MIFDFCMLVLWLFNDFCRENTNSTLLNNKSRKYCHILWICKNVLYFRNINVLIYKIQDKNYTDTGYRYKYVKYI